MTQNTSYSGSMSGSMSNDKGESKEDPNEIRADIDQTRQAVGDKIDQLQARLDPNRLKQQAQETVQEMISDTTESVKEYVRTHREEMVGSIADAARRNPLPTALVGLGVGWLILESMAGSKRHDDDRWESERRNLSSRPSRRPYEGNVGRSRMGYDNEYNSGYSSDVGAQYVGEYYDDDSFNEADFRASGYATRSEYQARQEYGNGHHRGSNPLAKAAGAVKDTVSDVTNEIKERVEDASEGIKERFSDVQERVGDVKDRMGEAVDDVRGQAGQMRQQGQQSMRQVRHQADEWQQRARWEGQRRGQQVMRNLEDNPLTYGALALAAGAAIAILLPQTRTENRYFGEMRDQVMDKGQEAFETAKGRAQEVVSEIRPELEEKARQIVSDVKEIGKEVAKDAVEELRPVVDKAVSKTKEEARNVAQEVGINPDKLTGSSTSSGSATGASSTGNASTSGTPVANKDQGKTPVVNRDTLRGQWTQIKGEVKSGWGQLTDDELTQMEGDYEKLVGAIQSRYGYTRGRVEQELNDFFNSRKA